MAASELAILLRAKNEAQAELSEVARALGATEHGFLGIPPAAAAASAAATAAIAVVVELTKSAYSLGAALDSAFDEIRQGTGATGDALESLKEDFRAVVVDVPTDFAKASEAITDLNRRTGATGDVLRELASAELELSRITNGDLGEQIRATTRLFGDWSVATEDQTETLNKLFRANQAGAGSVTGLAQRVVQYGAAWRGLGFDIDEALAWTAKAEKEGVNVETVLGTMRIALAKLAEAGLDPQESFKRLITTIQSIEDPVEQVAISMEVFGKRGGADMAAAIREGRFEIEAMQETITGAGDTIRGVASETDDSKEQMQKAMNELALAFEPVGAAVFQMAADAATWFAEFVKEGKNAVSEAQRIAKDIAEALHLSHPAIEPSQARQNLDLLAQAGLAPPGWIESEARRMAREIEAAQATIDAATDEPAPRPEPVGLSADELAAIRRANQEQRDAERAAQREAAREAREAAAEAAALQREAERQAKDAARAAEREVADAIREAERLAREAANVPIVGFMEGLQSNRANLGALVGDIAQGAAVDLERAFREGTAASGSALASDLDNLVDQLRRSGVVDNWRELGASYAETLHDALITGTDAAKVDALAALAELGATVAQAREQAQADAKRAQDLARGTEKLAEMARQLTERDAAAEAHRADAVLAAIRSAAERSVTAPADLLIQLTGDQRDIVNEAARVAGDIQSRRAALQAEQRAEMDRLTASFGDPQGESRERQRTETIRQARESVERAQFGGNSLEILKAMKAEQEAIARLLRDDAAVTARKAQEEAVAALRAQQARDQAELEQTLAREKLTRDVADINARAEAERTARDATYTAERTALEVQLGIAEDVKTVTDTWFDKALGDLAKLQAGVQEIKGPSLFGGSPSGEGGTGTTEKSGGVQIQLMPGSVVNNNYGLQGEDDIVEGIQDELVQRVLSRLAAAGA